MHYNFYYDESEHSRKISVKTVTADNYHDNFIAVIVGWCSDYEQELFAKYLCFEEKYQERKTHGELKSQTFSSGQFKNGFASLNRNNVEFLHDFLSFFDVNVRTYYAVFSKVSYIVEQLFVGYKNSLLSDMDALKYSITKSILMYRPLNVIQSMLDNDADKFLISLKRFYTDRIEKNKENASLKKVESESFQEILFVLNDIDSIQTLDWNYRFSFVGFQKYLNECSINDFLLTLDQEGEKQNTLTAAQNVGFNKAIEIDSKESVGVRIADMLAGLISKLLKAIRNALQYDLTVDVPEKKILPKEWFVLTPNQLALYKKLYQIICQTNNAYYKSFTSRYCDDFLMLVSLLNYMNSFSCVEDMKEDLAMHGEYFNAYACESLSVQFERMKSKISVEIENTENKDYIFNQRGAKVFLDISKQPFLKIAETEKGSKYLVLSVGFNQDALPLITVESSGKPICYRLPEALTDWAIDLVGFANMGENLFPAEVIFRKIRNKYYADIL